MFAQRANRAKKPVTNTYQETLTASNFPKQLAFQNFIVIVSIIYMMFILVNSQLVQSISLKSFCRMEKLRNVIPLSFAAWFKNYTKERFVCEFTIKDSSTPSKKKRKRKRKEKTDSWRSCYVYKSNAVSKFCLQSCLLNALAEIKTYLEDMPRKLKKITVWGCFFISVIKEIGKLNWSKYRWSCILNGSYFVGSWKINYRSKYNKVKG